MKATKLTSLIPNSINVGFKFYLLLKTLKSYYFGTKIVLHFGGALVSECLTVCECVFIAIFANLIFMYNVFPTALASYCHIDSLKLISHNRVVDCMVKYGRDYFLFFFLNKENT